MSDVQPFTAEQSRWLRSWRGPLVCAWGAGACFGLVMGSVLTAWFG